MSKNGDAYCKVTRTMVDNLIIEFKEFKAEIRKEFNDLKKTNQILYNHLSDRLPKWALVVGGIGAIILGSLFTALINNILNYGR